MHPHSCERIAREPVSFVRLRSAWLRCVSSVFRTVVWRANTELSRFARERVRVVQAPSATNTRPLVVLSVAALTGAARWQLAERSRALAVSRKLAREWPACP